MRTSRHYFLSLFTLLMYCFLYLPIVILVLFSFNESAYPYAWTGFSLHWYKKLFSSVGLLSALYNSFVVATASMTLSLVLAIFFVVFRPKNHYHRTLKLFLGGVAIPEIVLSVGLLSVFYFLTVPLGLTTIIAGHTLIGLGYTIPLIDSRFQELDDLFSEASLDLGATRMQTLTRIIIPLMSPAIIASGLLVFIVSLDDFVIAFLTSGATTQTLPIYIFSAIRSGATPVVNALSVLLLMISGVVIMIVSLLNINKADIV